MHILVGQAAGSSSDISARLIRQYLSEHLGQQSVVEIRPGATGNVATEAVVRSAPDGYTLLLVNSQNTINQALIPTLPFDFVHDIAPIAITHRVAMIMEVLPSFPAKTVPEFIAYAKPIRARSTWRRPASAARSIWPANCSSSWPASISCTSLITAPRRR